MRFAIGIFLAVLATGAVGWALPACGSSSSGSGSGSGYGVTHCPTAPVSDSCASCFETECASQLGAINSACGEYFACVCPVGADAEACVPSMACETASTANECPACTARCPGEVMGGSSSGGSSSDGGSASSDAGSGG